MSWSKSFHLKYLKAFSKEMQMGLKKYFAQTIHFLIFTNFNQASTLFKNLIWTSIITLALYHKSSRIDLFAISGTSGFQGPKFKCCSFNNKNGYRAGFELRSLGSLV